MLKTLLELLFDLTMLVLAIYSLILVYILFRFGQSKALSLVVSALYVIIMASLYAAALQNFNAVPFSDITFF